MNTTFLSPAFLKISISSEVLELLRPEITAKLSLPIIINRHLRKMEMPKACELSTRQLTVKCPIGIPPDLYQQIVAIDLDVDRVIDALLYQCVAVPTVSDPIPTMGTSAEPIEMPLEFGVLRRLDRSDRSINQQYYYWRYYDNRGKRKDRYMDTNIDRALAKIRAIGVPEDARGVRTNRAKKAWAV